MTDHITDSTVALQCVYLVASGSPVELGQAVLPVDQHHVVRMQDPKREREREKTQYY